MVTISGGGVGLEPLIIVKSPEAVQKLSSAPPVQKHQTMRIALVERFLDGLQRGVRRGNIKSGF
jgi:hypothetical protein